MRRPISRPTVAAPRATPPPPPVRARSPPPPLPHEGGHAHHRRSDGERSHREILRAAADLASVEGLHGLTIASLAKHVGLSKSGLFAHFRSKEELQLETIEAAVEIFREDVVAPALRAEGVARV